MPIQQLPTSRMLSNSLPSFCAASMLLQAYIVLLLLLLLCTFGHRPLPQHLWLMSRKREGRARLLCSRLQVVVVVVGLVCRRGKLCKSDAISRKAGRRDFNASRYLICEKWDSFAKTTHSVQTFAKLQVCQMLRIIMFRAFFVNNYGDDIGSLCCWLGGFPGGLRPAACLLWPGGQAGRAKFPPAAGGLRFC